MPCTPARPNHRCTRPKPIAMLKRRTFKRCRECSVFERIRVGPTSPLICERESEDVNAYEPMSQFLLRSLSRLLRSSARHESQTIPFHSLSDRE